MEHLKNIFVGLLMVLLMAIIFGIMILIVLMHGVIKFILIGLVILFVAYSWGKEIRNK